MNEIRFTKQGIFINGSASVEFNVSDTKNKLNKAENSNKKFNNKKKALGESDKKISGSTSCFINQKCQLINNNLTSQTDQIYIENKGNLRYLL